MDFLFLFLDGVGLLDFDFALLHELDELRLEQEVELLEFEALVEHREIDFVGDRDEAEDFVALLRDECLVVFVLTLLDQLCEEELAVGLLDFIRVGFEDHGEVVVVLLVGPAYFNQWVERGLGVVVERELVADGQVEVCELRVEVVGHRDLLQQLAQRVAEAGLQLLVVLRGRGQLLEPVDDRVGALDDVKDVGEHLAL